MCGTGAVYFVNPYQTAKGTRLQHPGLTMVVPPQLPVPPHEMVVSITSYGNSTPVGCVLPDYFDRL